MGQRPRRECRASRPAGRRTSRRVIAPWIRHPGFSVLGRQPVPPGSSGPEAGTSEPADPPRWGRCDVPSPMITSWSSSAHGRLCGSSSGGRRGWHDPPPLEIGCRRGMTAVVRRVLRPSAEDTRCDISPVGISPPVKQRRPPTTRGARGLRGEDQAGTVRGLP